MSTRIDIMGQRFGKLIVVEYAGKNKFNFVQWKCLCDCGSYRIAIGTTLRQGRVTHCGCSKKTSKINMLGKVFGRLTVTREAGRSKDKKVMWECSCSCSGKLIIISGVYLRNGHTRSCGCLRIDLLRSRSLLPKGVTSLNDFYRSYKTRAKKRKICFNLTKEEFRRLTQEPCFYCGDTTIRKAISESKKRKVNGPYMYVSGVDRLDSSRGYEKNNVVPCCHTCNFGKFTSPVEEFVIWLERASNNLPQLKQKLLEKGLLSAQT